MGNVTGGKRLEQSKFLIYLGHCSFDIIFALEEVRSEDVRQYRGVMTLRPNIGLPSLLPSAFWLLEPSMFASHK